MPSSSHKAFLTQASQTYYEAVRDVPAVRDYVTSRGISEASAQSFRLGVVGNPLPGHEAYRGRMTIPYLTPSGVVSLRFRCLSCDTPKCSGHPKYLGLPGDELRVYNPGALHKAGGTIAITEGEIDCITANQAGLNAVGLPGVASLRDYTHRLFAGYSTVWILADNDDAGQGSDFAERLADIIPGARILLMPDGHDVNSFVVENGSDALINMTKEAR